MTRRVVCLGAVFGAAITCIIMLVTAFLLMQPPVISMEVGDLIREYGVVILLACVLVTTLVCKPEWLHDIMTRIGLR